MSEFIFLCGTRIRLSDIVHYSPQGGKSKGDFVPGISYVLSITLARTNEPLVLKWDDSRGYSEAVQKLDAAFGVTL